MPDDLEKRQLLAELQEKMFRRRERVELGRYVLRERLGSGAMGVVYRAEDPQLRREVAVKVLHPQRTDVEAGHDRLRREARALGQVRHPNVIEVYDVGHAGERVFVAMELVEGESLEAWLVATPRAWRAVLEVFVQAGRGLAAAHRAGLVHRDFKPSNVQVGRRVCVLDFGLARAVQASSVTTPGDPSAAGIVTRDGAIVGTPRYMAPAQLLGAPADAASDQYAFCVALWEALFGEPPFDPDDMMTTKQSLERARLRPTSAVPLRIQRAIRRGLAPEAVDRFANMDALLDALGPRRRGAAAVGLLVVAGTIAGALASRPSAVRLDIADVQRARQNVALGFSVQAAYKRGHALAELDRVDEAIDVIEAAHRDAVTAGFDRKRFAMALELGSLEIQRRRDLAAGKRWLGDARAVLARMEPDPRLLFALSQAEAVLARAEGDGAAALASARETVRHARDGWGESVSLVRALQTVGVTALEQQQFEEARAVLHEAIEVGERTLAADDPLPAYCLSILAAVDASEATSAEADESLAERSVASARRAVEALERVLGPNHYDTVSARLTLGVALAEADRPREARDELQTTLDRFESAPQSDPRGIAMAAENLGTVLLDLGELEQAEATLHRAAVALGTLHGEDYPPLSTTLTHLGRVQRRRGAIAEARATYERAIILAREAGPGPLAVALGDLAELERDAGEGPRATELFEQAAAAWTTLNGPDSPQAQKMLEAARASAR